MEAEKLLKTAVDVTRTAPKASGAPGTVAETRQDADRRPGREIAVLTSKEHKNVMRDIRNMLEALKKDRLSFERIYKDGSGREQTEYALDREALGLSNAGIVTDAARIHRKQ